MQEQTNQDEGMYILRIERYQSSQDVGSVDLTLAFFGCFTTSIILLLGRGPHIDTRITHCYGEGLESPAKWGECL